MKTLEVSERQEKYLMNQYRLSLERYRAMYEAQGGRCAICLNTKALVVDHDHMCCAGTKSCGFCIRGLICGKCNTGLGMFNDSPQAMAVAQRYVFDFRKARGIVNTSTKKWKKRHPVEDYKLNLISPTPAREKL